MTSVILSRFPSQFGTLIEPFAGGAAVSLASGRDRIVLNDINPELIITYEMVAFKLSQVISQLNAWGTSREDYLAIRSMTWTSMMPVQIAARFIYLNKLGVKGLYRVNKKGGFNTPYDHTASGKRIVDLPTLQAASEIFQRIEISCGHYSRVMDRALPGDLIFCDPPYVPFSKNGFVNYSATGFSEDDHRELAECVKRCRARGVHVILTNSDTPLVRELYKDLPIIEIITKNSMNTSKAGDKSYVELMINGVI